MASLAKTVAVYFKAPGAMDYPFDADYYYDSYKRFSAICEQAGIRLAIVRGDSYRGSMRFESGWIFKDGQLTAENDIVADMVIVKSIGANLAQEPGQIFLNTLEFDAIVNDKWRTYELFSQYMKPTYRIGRDNWQEVLAGITTEKVVLKPVHGEGGDGVYVLDKADCDLSDFDFSEDYLAQEFIDASSGIPGITEGPHDLRILCVNGVTNLSFVRIPAPGKMLANLAQGGSLRILEPQEIPEAALEVVREVDKQAVGYSNPRMYAVDFMFENGRPYIVEINPQPGFPYEMHGEAYMAEFYRSLLALIKSSLA